MMPWGRLFHPHDSCGRESRTLLIVGITWLFLTARFAAGGIDFAVGSFHWAVQPSTLLDYGASTTGLLAAWLSREYIKGKGAPSNV